jgi:hypothetical protein
MNDGQKPILSHPNPESDSISGMFLPELIWFAALFLLFVTLALVLK